MISCSFLTSCFFYKSHTKKILLSDFYIYRLVFIFPLSFYFVSFVVDQYAISLLLQSNIKTYLSIYLLYIHCLLLCYHNSLPSSEGTTMLLLR